MLQYNDVFTVRRLWTVLAVSMAIMFSVLLYYGNEIYQQAPPIPQRIVTVDGTEIFTSAATQRGQNVWQSLGGMQRGSIWGHGSYLAPDWSADWLHREAISWLDQSARRRNGLQFSVLNLEQQEVLKTLLRLEFRENTFNPTTDSVTITNERAAAIAEVAAHYAALFQGNGDAETEMLTTGGGLLFAGDANRRFYAIDQFTGETLWQTILNGATDMAPISFAVDGQQFVAVLSPSGTQDSAAHAGQLNLGVPTGVANLGHSIFVFALPKSN